MLQKAPPIKVKIAVEENSTDRTWTIEWMIKLEKRAVQQPITEDILMVPGRSGMEFQSEHEAIEEAKRRSRETIKEKCGAMNEAEIEWNIERRHRA